MKKLFLVLGLIFPLFLLLPVPLLAQEEGVSEKALIEPDFIVPPPVSEPGFLGQDHNYTIVFRGNGEAVVSVRVVFTNKTESDLSEIKLRVPRVEPSQVSVYQVIKQGRCLRYLPQEYDLLTQTYKPQECAEYAEPDYYQSYYSDAKYQKAEYQLNIDTLKIKFPQAVKPEKSGSFFVYFRAMGYAKKNIFGSFQYTFETLKAEDDIRSLRVGISTDSDLVLRGVKGEVSYRFEEPGLANLESAGAAMAPQKSVAIDRYVSQIGQGRITKTASNLAPLESYEVKGAYASSVAKLYAKELSIAGFAILVFLAVLVFIGRLIYKKVKLAKATETGKPEAAKASDNVQLALISLGVSFIFSLLALGYTVGIFLVGSLINKVIGYQYDLVFAIFLIIISFGVYGLLLLGPGIYFGVKKGVGWGMATVILTILWLIFYLLVAMMVVFLFGSRRVSPIIPLLQGIY